jgi:RNA polymerase sigma-70 factor (ECF subfamily)
LITNRSILGFSNVKSAPLHSGIESHTQSGTLFCLPLGASVLTPKQQKKPARAEVYWLHRVPVDFYSFDAEYLRRLGAHDPATETHFVAYFSERLKITLRARGEDSHTIEDIIQETFCRVWTAVQAGKIVNPPALGAYVHSMCKNVRSETRRGDRRIQHEPLDSTDVADERLSLDDFMQRKEIGKLVQAILSELPERDRHLLHARFFEDRDNDDVCSDFGVDRNYLRVLFHRATNKFGELYKKRNN